MSRPLKRPWRRVGYAPKFEAQNNRRIDLIHKKHLGGGLTAEEEAELEQVTEAVRKFIDRHFPLPTQKLEELEKALGLAAAPPGEPRAEEQRR